VTQVAAFVIVAVQLWPRVGAKAVRAKSAAPARTSPEK
jgi:hypothetical protein